MAVVLLLVIGILLSASAEDRTSVRTRAEGNNSTFVSSFHITPILWGELCAQVDKQVIQIERYSTKIVNMNITYRPYFIQYFPVWVEISVVHAPPWLVVVPSVKEFIIQRGETRTVKIHLAIIEDVENGTNDFVMLEIYGRNLILPSLLDIAYARTSFAVVKIW